MFRRSRFSVRPNVGATGRTAATPQEATTANQEASETPRHVGESSAHTAVTDTTSVVTPSEKITVPGDGNDQNGEGANSSAAVQRRKRFSVKPKVAPGRPSAHARTPKTPAKAPFETPVEVPSSDLDKPATSSQPGTTAAPHGLQSPKQRRPSEESKQPKPTPNSSDSSGPSAVSLPDESVEENNLPTDSGKQLEGKSDGQVKEVPPRPPDKVPRSIPDREAVELSEKAKTLMSSKGGLSLSPSALSLSRLLNDPSDLQRLAKAQKLRELLRQERHKETKRKKSKARVKEYTLDPAKMTMRDLIHYLPVSNPMTSSFEDLSQENETVIPPSPAREQSPETAKEPEVPPKMICPREEGEEVADEEEEDEDDSVMVPQLKVAEDGSLIIDEESLTVEVQRAKGPNPAEGRDPIFERGSTTTYSSFRKATYSKPWSSEETDMFYLAVSMVGTDFSMICQLFTHRARSEIKNKFKKEERENAWRIDKAFRERRKLDIEYFSKLLEKILEVQKNRKKLKSLTKKNSESKKCKRKAKGKNAARKLSAVEEEDEDDANEVPDLEDEEEGEKENEDLCNEGGTPVSKPMRQHKRKSRQAAVTQEPNNKKKKTGEKSNKQGETCKPEDTEAAPPEDHITSDMSEKTEDVDVSKDTAIKPAKLSQGRAPKPLLPLGRKWGKKPLPPSTKAKDNASDKGDESATDGASHEQVINDSSPSRQANKNTADAEISSEEEEACVQPPRPTRYGRMPKPTKPLNYPAKEVAHTSASDTTPALPVGSTVSAAKPKPKCTAKRGRSSKQKSAPESKKAKLVTLRASRSEHSDEEDEKLQDEEGQEEECPVCSPSEDGIAPVFVPASLRSPRPVISEVEETLEELDVLANIPDVLGISQDAMCPDASCEWAQNETGTTEPSEHQLDLLVDVIDFLSTEHTEVSEDEGYNEAAQTLLTIGNLTHLPQSAQNQEDHITETTSVGVEQTGQHLEEETASKPTAQEEIDDTLVMFIHGDIETSETIASVEPQEGTTDRCDNALITTSDLPCAGQKIVSDTDPSPQLQSSPESSKKNSLQTRKGRVSKVKPKPNLGRSSRTAQPKSQPETSTSQTAKESNRETANCQVTESPSAPEETTPEIPECSPNSLKDDISCTKVTLTEKLSVSQDSSVGQVESGAAASAQRASENQSHYSSDAQFEPSREQARTDTMSKAETEPESQAEKIKSFCNYSVTSDTSVTESHVEQGSNTDSVPVQEGSQHSAAFVTPADEVSVGQKAESEVTSTCQSRRTRLQKVKPKLNLPGTPRTTRSKPKSTKDSVEKDCSSTPTSKTHEKAIAEVEPEATSSENPSSSFGPASVLTSSFDLGFTLTPMNKLSTTAEKRTDDGLLGQLHFVAATSDQSTSENQILSQTPSEPSNRGTGSSGSKDDKGAAHDGTPESSDNLLTYNQAVTQSQVEKYLGSVQDSIDLPALCVTPVDLPVYQKEESKVASTCQIKRGQSIKVKPKPNLPEMSRTTRSKPQSTKDSVEKDCSPIPNSKIHEKAIAEVEPESTCGTSSENPSSSSGPASVFTPSFDFGSTLTSTKELSTTEEMRTDDGLLGQVYSVAATSDQSSSENQILSQTPSEPSNRVTGSTSASTDDKGATHDGTTNTNDDLETHNPAVTELQVEKNSGSVQDSSDLPAQCITPVDLPVSQKEESEVASTCQVKRGRSIKVKPKPNLPGTSRTMWSKPQSTKDSVEKNCSQTPISKVHEKAKAVVESEATPGTYSENPSSSSGPASVFTPSFDFGSTLTPTKELSTTEETKTDDGLLGQLYSVAATSHQRTSENQILSQTLSEPNNKDTGSTSGSTDDKGATHDGTTNTSDDLVTYNPAVTQSQVEKDIGSVQESSDLPAPCVTPVDLPVSQKEESEVASTCQIKRGRSLKVKPKPNLPGTSRTTWSKSQSTKDSVEKDCCPIPNSKIQEKAIAEVEPEATCGNSSENRSSSSGPASVLTPSFHLDSTLTAAKELSTTEETRTDDGLLCQVYSIAATSDQSSSENQIFSQILSEPSNRDTGSTSGSTDDKGATHDGTTNTSDDLETHNPAVTELQVEKNSGSVQDSSDLPAPCATPVDLPVSQKEKSEVASTCQVKRGRSIKIKPKPNLAQISRTIRSKPQSTKDSVKKDCSPIQTSKVHEKAVEEVESEATSGTYSENPSSSSGPTSVLKPSFDFGSTLTPTKELSTTEETETDDGLLGQLYSVAANSDQSTSKNQILSQTPSEPSNRGTGSSGSKDDKGATHDGTPESSDNLLTYNQAVTQSQVEKYLGSVQDSIDLPAPCVTPADLPVSKKEESEVESTCQIKRGRSLKVKPKPTLAQISRTIRSKPQSKKDSVEKDCSPIPISKVHEKAIAEVEPEATCGTSSENPSSSSGPASVFTPSFDFGSTLTPIKELSTTEETRTYDGLLGQLYSVAATSHQTTSENLILSQTPSEPNNRDTGSTSGFTDNKDDGETESRDTASVSRLIDQSSDKLVTSDLDVTESQVGKDSASDQDSSDHPAPRVTPVEDLPVSQKEESEAASTCKSTRGRSQRVKPKPNLAQTSRSIGSRPQTTKDSVVQLVERPSSPTVKPRSIDNTTAEGEKEKETRETNETSTNKPKLTDSTQSEPTESSKTSIKGPQSHRGRLIKPKPNLGRSSRPPQPRQVQNTTQAETDSDAQLECVDGSDSRNLVSELRPDIQEPVERAGKHISNQEPLPNDVGSSLGGMTQINDQPSQNDSHRNDAISSLGCVTQVLENTSQNTSTLSTEGPQSPQSLRLLPDLMSDSDEPFFILSLTEIPVCSSGEVMDSADQPRPCLPAGNAPTQQQSVPGERLAPGGDGYQMPTKETGEMGFSSVKYAGPEPAACMDSIAENPVDSQDSRPAVQPPILPETEENNAKIEIPPAKQRTSATGRRAAKLQVKPNTTKNTHASKAFAANNNQDSDLPGPSMQPEASNANTIAGKDIVTEPQNRGVGHENIGKESQASCKGSEERSSGAQTHTAKSRGTNIGKRKPKDFLPVLSDVNTTVPSSDPSPGKAASKGPKVKTQRTTRKGSTTTSVASTSHAVALTPSPTQQPAEADSTSSATSPALTEVDNLQTTGHGQLYSDAIHCTSQCSAEVSEPEQGNCVESSSIEEEPTNVSQYFLSDIFTEVEEG
ncbi:mucin-12 isoform X1 [Scophthalmus maximus]|uniref:mucin-12 isoform X1 n=1 Tax=Scophthalmus maximus TaxID=52904 RepID=UPI0015E0C138|nr:mucin-12 isoform X1 [Scophthalmus maximus]